MNQDIYESAGIIIVDRKLLFTRAKDMEIFIDPGDQIEANETPEQALVRELKKSSLLTSMNQIWNFSVNMLRKPQITKAAQYT